MPRLISVALTERQVRDRSKTVTRRSGSLFLESGDPLTLVRKSQGRKRKDGSVEPLVYLAEVEVVSVRRERLDAITDEDVCREGFPLWSRETFIEFFTASMGVSRDTEVTRIEFRYLEAVSDG